MIKRLLKVTLGFNLAAALCLTAAYFGHHYWTNGRFIEATDNAYVRGDIVAIAPKVPGYIVKVAVRDNQMVEAGDVLFRIDPEDYEVKRAQAAAGLSAALAAKASLAEERALQETLIAEAEAGLAAAHAEATRAERDRQRADKLVAGGWTTQQRHDTAVAVEARARASVTQAEAGLAARRQRLAVIDAEAVRLDAAIEQATAQLRLAEIALNDAVVRAPVAGVVGNRHVEVGHYARPGAPLLSIVVSEEVWVVANFKETQLGRLAPGQAVAVRVDTFGDQEIAGRIDSLAPASGAEFSLLPPDNATGNFVRVVQRIPVKIILDEQAIAQAGLRPGMSAEVRIDTRGEGAPRTASLFETAWAAVAELRGDTVEAPK
ncbi:MAG TPA: HlyD family secretion protein [Kaistia sp.]|jgi:membrane fusion protein (multidrug efflux system)|nr:HlyD family secretion protein [Kaistia sp.]